MFAFPVALFALMQIRLCSYFDRAVSTRYCFLRIERPVECIVMVEGKEEAGLLMKEDAGFLRGVS